MPDVSVTRASGMGSGNGLFKRTGTWPVTGSALRRALSPFQIPTRDRLNAARRATKAPAHPAICDCQDVSAQAAAPLSAV